MLVSINDSNKDFGQLIFQNEQEPLGFSEKYNKMTIPMVMVGVGILFSIPGLMDRILISANLQQFAGYESLIPLPVIWIFLGISVLYFIFCLKKVSNLKNPQVSVYQNGAVLNLFNKTYKFHFDEYKWFDEYGFFKSKETVAYIYLNSKPAEITLRVEDIPILTQFINHLYTAYVAYILGKIQSEGINNISCAFSQWHTLEKGNLVDS